MQHRHTNNSRQHEKLSCRHREYHEAGAALNYSVILAKPRYCGLRRSALCTPGSPQAGCQAALQHGRLVRTVDSKEGAPTVAAAAIALVILAVAATQPSISAATEATATAVVATQRPRHRNIGAMTSARCAVLCTHEYRIVDMLQAERLRKSRSATRSPRRRATPGRRRAPFCPLARART